MTGINFATAASWIATGEVSCILACMKNREINVEEVDENGQTLLMLACQRGINIIVDNLLELRSNVNAVDLDNWTPLLNACKGGYYDIAVKLLARGAKVDHKDLAGWTGLMWCCYKGHETLAQFLLEHGANPNVADQYNISCLAWAAGRGFSTIVSQLLAHGAKVNVGDKYGTTPLVWACRKGYREIVRSLLAAGANVDTAGMHSWTPLIVATRGNFPDVVSMLLEHRPNINSADRDSCTALTIACKEGYPEIATAVISAGAYINMQDRNGDTNLIHAAKAGHAAIVEALLRKYADVDCQGEDGKTALYWACEKNHMEVCRLILRYEANVDLTTKDGDTPLMKATRNRNLEIVQLLIEKKAKVSLVDKQGDTALHIAMRARSKAIVEVLLRNPRHSQLLYRLNRAGETPYNIDTTYQKSILSQIFGARRLNTNEDTENMLGYDLYSSALADILSEPSLSMPICTGLYAKWGSGKSFLLNKLEGELSNFTFQPPEKPQSGKWAGLALLVVGLLLGLVAGLASWHWQLGLGMAGATILAGIIALLLLHCGVKRYDWSWAFSLSLAMSHQLSRLQRFLQVLFFQPPTSAEDLPVRFVFIKQTKVNSSSDTEQSPVSQIVVQLHRALEKEFGFFTTRFARVLKPRASGSRKATMRKVCCIPVWVLAVVGVGATGICLALGPIYARGGSHVGSALLAAGCVLAALVLASSHTLLRLANTLLVSHHRRVFHSASCHTHLLKKEIDAITASVKCLDGFYSQQTRLVVIVDGLDSCEVNKVLRVLDSVNLLFSTPNSPFVLILALDPHLIIKAVESHVSSVGGYDFLRNLVHLPFYLQNSGLRRAAMAQQVAAALRKSAPAIHEENLLRKSSNSSNISELIRTGNKSRLAQVRLRPSDSINSSINNLASGAPRGTVFGPHDLTRVLLTDDYFSDVNPRSMRRLLNIIYITGRLLKAFNIEFNWFHLASWVNITERWPYRISWVLLYFEMHESEFEDTAPLRFIYDRVKPFFPDSKELSLLDHDDRKLEVVLSVHSTSLLVADLKIFMPFTINLDPFIRKSIQEDNQHVMELLRPGSTSKPSSSIKTSASKWSIRALPPPKSESTSEPSSAPPEPAAPPPAPYRRLTSNMAGVRLSHMNTEEVNHYLATRVEMLDKSRLPAYQAAISQQNLNGLVLSTCDLTELKAVLNMAFGDWEIFKLHLQALREQESALPASPPTAEFRIVPATPSNTLEKQPVWMTSTLAQQVTLEESMLFGALETLNEETQEVAAAEELSFSSDPAELNVLYLHSPRDSPLPPKGVGSLNSSVVELSSVRCSLPIDIPMRDAFSPSLASSPSFSSSKCPDCPGGECVTNSKSLPEDYPSDDEHTPLVTPTHHPPSATSPPRVLERQLSLHMPLMDPANDRSYGDVSFSMSPNETVL